MGYYADLIKQKQEKRNSAESHLKGLIGKKFKRDTDLERAVNGSIYTEISDWSHPRMVVFDKYTDEKYILTTEDNNKYGKDQEFWISKVQKVNSKEEKQNFRDPLGLGLTFHELGTPDDYKAKFKKGDKVKLRYGSGFKGEGVIVEGPIKMRASLTPTYRIKLTDGKVVGRYEEELAKNSKDNEKEEKENADSAYIEASQKAERIINRMLQSRDKKEARAFLQKIGWNVSTLGEDPADYARAIRRAVRNYPEKSAEILSNSKEEKQNFDMAYFRKMYDEVQELKRKGVKGANIDKYYAAINQYKEAEEYMKLYKETGKSYHKASADSLKREADRWMREVKESIHNSDEEKDNEDPQIATLRRKALQKIKEAQKKADWYGDTVMQKFEKDLTYAEEEDVPELAGMLDRYLPKFEAKVKSFGNSNEEKGYYAKLAEEKKNASITDHDILVAQVLIDRIIMHCQKAKRDMKNWNRDWFNYDNWKSKAEQAESIVKDLHI